MAAPRCISLTLVHRRAPSCTSTLHHSLLQARIGLGARVVRRFLWPKAKPQPAKPQQQQQLASTSVSPFSGRVKVRPVSIDDDHDDDNDSTIATAATTANNGDTAARQCTNRVNRNSDGKAIEAKHQEPQPPQPPPHPQQQQQQLQLLELHHGKRWQEPRPKPCAVVDAELRFNPALYLVVLLFFSQGMGL